MQSIRNIMPLVILSGAILAASISCGQNSTQTQPAQKEADKNLPPVQIAVAGPLTGDNAQFGHKMRLGAEIALFEVNAAGGIHGRPLQITYEDDAGSQQEANNVANKLVTNKDLMAVIGHFNSSCSLAGKPIYKEAKIVMFSPGSTNVTVCKGSDYAFRNIFTDEFQGHSLAEYISKVLQM
ncbi:MAG: ABC transporter substrate-binding protein, partial [bacterium]